MHPADRLARRVQLLGVAGVCVSLYALHVERSMAANPFYEPACVTRWGSCATVFQSSHAHLLSHWNLVAKAGPLDLSLATLGALNYGLYVAYPLWPSRAKAAALLALASASCAFSVYLLYVLKFILNDFCIVCSTFHLINFSMLLFGAVPAYRRTNSKRA
mmetsp:Transcript_22887/g.71767  ORF Transcript_22887/g.71767 Transcript_22887/m.71767 type:complete len:160 (+) Transcript_22887:109-588(+)